MLRCVGLHWRRPKLASRAFNNAFESLRDAGDRHTDDEASDAGRRNAIDWRAAARLLARRRARRRNNAQIQHGGQHLRDDGRARRAEQRKHDRHNLCIDASETVSEAVSDERTGTTMAMSVASAMSTSAASARRRKPRLKQRQFGS